MRRKILMQSTGLFAALMMGFGSPSVESNTAVSSSDRGVAEILKSFVADFAHDPFASEVVFGFEIDQERWHMTLDRSESGEVQAMLHEGFPEDPILYWEMTEATLRRFDAGMNGETATSRARADDPIPLLTRATRGFPRYLINSDLNEYLENLRFHFWTRGQPEVFPLSTEHARASHGGNVVGLVYQEGLRTIWYQVLPGQRVNEAPEEQVNPFHSLIVVSRGRVQARMDGKEMMLEANHAYLIPAGMSHEFWNDSDEPFEGVLIMYGEGA